jgi:succinate dehydrogenase/fumarate reductase flavoprotein subunit
MNKEQERNKEIDEGLFSEGLSRRGFLVAAASAGVLGAGAGILAGCAPASSAPETPAASTGGGGGGGAADWLGAPQEIAEGDVARTVETEILVVGAGTAGCFAACAAVEEGAQTILIDKQPEIGNGVRDTLAALNSTQQQETGDNPDAFTIINEMTRHSSGYGDERLYKIWADHSGEAIDWYTERLAENGYEFKFETSTLGTLNTPHYDVGHSLQWSDPADPNVGSFTMTSGFLLDYGKGRGLEVHMGTTMLQLSQEGERVTGLYAETEEGIVQYRASKGVIVCTGGYAANTEMLEALQPGTLDMASVHFAFPSCTGDGIKAMLWAGAAMDPVHAGMIFDRGAVPPDSTDVADGNFFWMGSQPFLKVNLDGNRFTNESGPYDFILHTANGIREKTYCTVWDSNYAADILRFETHGCSRLYPYNNGALPVMPLDPVVAGMNAELAAAGVIVEASSVEELAERLNIPADAFAATVARYNELADAGADSDFGKEAHRLSHLAAAPFYGVRQRGGYFITTLDGVRIDTGMRVLDEAGKPIEGLYAAGDCSGGYYGISYVNLLAGDAAGRSVTFGRLAGKAVAQL